MASIFGVSYYIFMGDNTSKSTRVSKSICLTQWRLSARFALDKHSLLASFLLADFVRDFASRNTSKMTRG